MKVEATKETTIFQPITLTIKIESEKDRSIVNHLLECAEIRANCSLRSDVTDLQNALLCQLRNPK